MPKGVEHHRTHRLSDELDGLLRAYFRAEMPDPWPSAPGVAPPLRVQAPCWRRYHGRLALAAAVSFFLVGSFLLTQSYPEVKDSVTHNSPETKGLFIGTNDSNKKRPQIIDPGKMREQLAPLKADLPRMEVLPLEETPTNRSFGVRNTKNGVIIFNAVGEKKAP
jgi:hypothetical protein